MQKKEWEEEEIDDSQWNENKHLLKSKINFIF